MVGARLPYPPLLRLVGYSGIVLLVLLGLAAMHGGVSATSQPGGHVPARIAVAVAHTSARAPAPAAVQPAIVRHGAAVAQAVSAAVEARSSGAAHDPGLVAGCVLALTGLVTLALTVCLRRGSAPGSLGLPRRHRWRRQLAPFGRAGPAARPRFLLCILRT